MLRKTLDFLPGLLLCAAITIVALVLQAIEVHYAGEPYLEALVAAILIGVAIRTFWKPGAAFEPGIHFSGKVLLEIAIVLLGFSLNATAVAELGGFLLGGIAITVVLALFMSYSIGRAFGLPQRMAILVACGNSICGNSAIAAVAPVIGADSKDVASSIAFTAVLGVVVVLTLPLLVPLLHLTVTQYGVLAGLTVYAVPQVLAATLPIGALANQIGTVVKLVRVLMLGPVVFGLSLFAARLRQTSCTASRKLPLSELVPWFIIGFLLAALARSLGLVPLAAIKPIIVVAGLLTTVSMAALGLGVDIRVVARAGLRVTAAVTVSLIVLALISLALIHAVGIQ
ncbi:MAG: putative sulfate exporter family transporter [Pseudolabrys sp.]|nr:putative sulfate exporter family transporter [Pseudolabrys sp.]